MPKTRIYRRLFNPAKGDLKVGTLLCVFPAGAELEAEFFLNQLQTKSTSFNENLFTKYRYTSVVEAPPPAKPSESKDIQVDVSKAQKTVRPISYSLSWEVKHGECHCLAWHRQYGSIRGIVEDSPQGRRLFRHRIMAVWPNADIISK